jgi:hypothetical protein
MQMSSFARDAAAFAAVVSFVAICGLWSEVLHALT